VSDSCGAPPKMGVRRERDSPYGPQLCEPTTKKRSPEPPLVGAGQITCITKAPEKKAPAGEGEGQRQVTWGRPQAREEGAMLFLAQDSSHTSGRNRPMPIGWWLWQADAGSCVRRLLEGAGPPLCADPTTPPVSEGPIA
jgi:hypothetical protein